MLYASGLGDPCGNINTTDEKCAYCGWWVCTSCSYIDDHGVVCVKCSYDINK